MTDKGNVGLQAGALASAGIVVNGFKTDSLHFRVNSRWRRGTWLVLLLIHVIFAGALSLLAWLYLIKVRALTKNYQYLVNGDGLGDFPDRNRTWIGVGYALLGGLFLLGGVEMLVLSLRARTLVFIGTWRPGRVHHGNPSWVPDPANPTTTQSRRFLQSILATGRGIAQSVGVRGQYFGAWLLVRESVEVALQIYQGYVLSHSTNNGVFTMLYGWIVLGNCWSTPLIQAFLTGDPSHQRLLCVLADVLLDFCWGAGVQFSLLAPFLLPMLIAGYRSAHMSQTAVNILLLEWRQAMITSGWQFVLSVVPYLSALWSVTSIKRVLHTTVGSMPAQVALSAIVPASSTADQTLTMRIGTRSIMAKATHLRLATRIHRLVMMAMGVGVWLIAAQARGYLGAEAPWCDYMIRPWLARKKICTMVKIDCGKLRITGQEKEIDAIFSVTATYNVTHVSFTHCAKLEIPPRVQTFDQLAFFFVINSTLARWDVESALSSHFFPILSTVTIQNVEITSIPFGLFAVRAPPSLDFISIENTSVTAFVDLIHDSWQRVASLSCSRCNLTAVPAFITEMTMLSSLDLSFNRIEHITPLFTSAWLSSLGLAGNPVATLPEDVWAMALMQFWWLDISETHITEIPWWVLTAPDSWLWIQATATPLCLGHQEVVFLNDTQTIGIYC